MKKCFLIVCGIIFGCTAWAGETVIISTGEYAPFTTNSLKNHGFVNHVIIEAFKRENHEVKFNYFPWKRAFKVMASGNCHASSFWYESEKRKKDAYYSNHPIYTAKENFFYLKSNPIGDWSTLKDLKGKRIGAVIGYTYSFEFWDLGKKKVYLIDQVAKESLNFKKLLHGRIDLFPTNIVVANDIMRKEIDPDKRDLITYHPKPFIQTPAFLLFSKAQKDSQKLLEVFNSGMTELIDQGIYEKLYNDLLEGKYSQ
ncbi:MAG: amino acid ABC transporter substrate-binding protein [Desulfobacteraceae bacterium]|nr:amino acid ABC transporter substrate-binding protein [Desulfobacteraceae bacterium]